MIDMEISHEEFVTILKGKDKYEKMKKKLQNLTKKQENIRLNGEFKDLKNKKLVDNLRNW